MFKHIGTRSKRTAALALALCVVALPVLAAPTQVASQAPQQTQGQPPAQPQRTFSFSAKGNVAMPDPITVTAPVGGQVPNFEWVPGDAVTADTWVMTLTPTLLYAPADGVIRSLRGVKVGELAEHPQALYGALCYVERQGIWHIQASTQDAYDDPKNRDVRVGDVLRVQHGSGDSEISGTGTVISVDGKAFVVEMPLGEFELEDDVKLYLGTGDTFKSKDRVGKGDVCRPALLPVTGSGMIGNVYVAEGDPVTAGQPLFLLDSASARFASDTPGTEAMPFGTDGVIGEILVRPGQFVSQGQALLTVLPTGALEASLEVDELDIARVEIGQRVRVAVDAYPDQERVATVREIRPLGITVLDTTKYSVRVTFQDTAGLLMGMHVTGYWD